MLKKRILVVYATAGTGHKKAALAIKKALDLIGSADVDIIDSLDYASSFFKFSYPRFYIYMVNRIPFIWGIFYYLLDNKIFYGLVSWMRHLGNWINGRPLAKYLYEKNYDTIISTHFFAQDVIAMEGRDKISSQLINVITDYRTHSFWITDRTDTYVVAHLKTREDLMTKYSVASDKIKVMGIPIDPVFSKNKDKALISAKLGIRKGFFTVLIGSGGFGVGPIIELVKAFKGISVPAELLVVCGKNESLFNDVVALKEYVGIPMEVYGFVDNMDELMHISDVIVTKTGGMMSSEALSKGLPIIGISPIPGQETRNFNMLVENGVVFEAKESEDAPKIVERMYNDRELMAGLRIKIGLMNKTQAAYDIARLALGE